MRMKAWQDKTRQDNHEHKHETIIRPDQTRPEIQEQREDKDRQDQDRDQDRDQDKRLEKSSPNTSQTYQDRHNKTDTTDRHNKADTLQTTVAQQDRHKTDTTQKYKNRHNTTDTPRQTTR